MTTYTTQPDGTDGIDNCIYYGAPTTNNGSDTTMSIGADSGTPAGGRGLIKFDLAKGSNPPTPTAIVSSITFTPTCTAYRNTKTISIYQILRNWTEGGSTWNKYDASNNWGTAGCGNTTTDRSATVLGSVSVTGTGAFNIVLNASGIAVVQGWVDGSIPNYGWLIKGDSETNNANTFGTSDNATAGNRPQLEIVWEDTASMGIIGPFFKEQREKLKKYWQGWSLKGGIFQPELGLSI